MKRELKLDLLHRWGCYLDEDLQTDGLWDDVERVLGRRATEVEQREIVELNRIEGERLKRRGRPYRKTPAPATGKENGK